VNIKVQQGEYPFGEEHTIPTAETPINMDLHHQHQQQQQQQQQIRLDTSNKSASTNDPDFYPTATSFEELSSPIPQQPFDPSMALSNSSTAASVDTNNSESSQMQHLFHNDLNHMALSSPTNSRHQQNTLSMTSSPTQLIQMTVNTNHLFMMYIH
jgi:hypothetical protein